MNNVNTIVICRETYENQEAFQDAIRDAVMVLLNNDYTMVVRYDEPGLGIVVIEFDHRDSELCERHPEWLTWQEYESIIWDDEREDNV